MQKLLKDPLNLIWLDMEMTGLEPHHHVILEVAVVITNNNLEVIAESPSYAIYQPAAELKKMDKWNVSTHNKSGLIPRVKESSYDVETVEKELLKLIRKYSPKNTSPLCGNTIHQDRKFLAIYMPKLEGYLHYRNLDVSTLKELARRWYGNIHKGFTKHNKHEALADIYESIAELKYYQDKLLIKPNSSSTITG